MVRMVLEGTWSGYRSSQEHVVHRTIASKRVVETVQNGLTSTAYSDGTSLYLSLREAKPRERIREIHGYDRLIDDCISYNVSSVDQLCERRK